MFKQRYDMVGKRFNKLTVIKYLYSDKYKNACWECKCDCGNKVIVNSHDLKSGHTKSCGCLQKQRASESRTKHNMCDSRIYHIWKGIKLRCYNPNNPAYKNYGGRGIIVCDEWLKDFKAFYNWALANGYNDDLTIDRIDVNGGYKPNNCRWITIQEQAKNRRSNHYITHNGKTQNISDWSKELGINRTTLTRKLKKGMSIKQITESS